MTLTTMLLIGAAIVAIAAAPLLLPANIHVERSAIVDATPDTILALAASNTGYQAFNPYKSTDPDLRITPFGPTSGIGSGFHFEGKEGKGSQTVAGISQSSVTYAIDLGPMGQPTQTITAIPSEGGTKVTWSLDADMGLNPIARIFGLFMDGMMGKTFNRGLDNLAKAA